MKSNDPENLRVLHIDDTKLDRETVFNLLAKEGISVLSIDSEIRFREVVAKEQFDAIVSDLSMGVLNGKDIIRIVGELNLQVPVLILTGTGTEDIAVDLLKSGAADYILKRQPHIKRLAPAIRKSIALNQSEASRIRAGESLRRSESRYRILFENMLNGFAHCHILRDNGNPIDFVYLEVNKSFEVLTGLTNVEGKRVTDVIPGVRESSPELFEIYGRVALSGHPERFETWIETLKIWLDISVYSTEKEDFVAIFDNITERKKIERNMLGLNRTHVVLSNINQLIVREKNRQKLLDEACRIAVEDGNFLMSWIGFVNPRTGIIDVAAQAGDTSGYFEHIRLAHGNSGEVAHPVGKALSEGHPVVCNDIDHDPMLAQWRDQLKSQSIRSVAAFPLHNAGAEAGVYYLISGDLDCFTKEELKLLSELSEDISFALESIQVDLRRKDAENALRSSESRFRSIMENAPVGIYVIGIDGTFLSVNESMQKMLGYSIDEIYGKNFNDITCKEDQEIGSSYLQRALSGETNSFTFEKRYIHKDGHIVWVAVSSSLIRDSSNMPLYFVSHIQDVSARKEADDKIKHSEERLRILFEHAPDGYYLTDLEGVFLDVNKACEMITGYSKEELVGKSIMNMNFFSPDEMSHVSTMIATVRLGERVGPEEIVLTSKSGEIYSLEVIAHPVEVNGKTIVLGIVRDITNWNRTQRSLKQLSRAVEQSPVSIIITNKYGDIEYVNPRFTHVTGYGFDEVKGKNPRLLQSGKTPPEAYAQLWSSILAGNEWRGQFYNKKKSGEVFLEMASISPVRDDDGVIANFVAVKEDITERKLLEDRLLQAQKLESVGTLAGGVAHDFNNILAIIMGHASLIDKHKSDSAKVTQSIGAINKATLRGASLVRQLLIFARKTDVNVESIRMNEQIKELTNLLTETLPKMIVINLKLAERLPSVIADATQIQQVLLNLCVNARDAMPKGGTLTIATFVQLGNVLQEEYDSATYPEYVAVTVTDTGIGMTEDVRKRVFEPFFTTKGIGKGTGLGLSVVFGIVQNHNGIIDVKSNCGRGTTFYLYLPTQAKTIVTLDEKVVEHQVSVGGNETILIVEDEDELREISKGVLEKKGYNVLCAGDGQEAIMIFRERMKEIDLVITDMGLPFMNGAELLRQLVKIKPSVKVIIASGYLEPEIKSQALKSGAKQFIQKPYVLENMAAKIREVLDLH